MLMYSPQTVLAQLQAAFAQAFECVPRALCVWNAGVQIRCNAALQYASAMAIPLEQAAAYFLQSPPVHAAVAPWHADADGMLCTFFLDDYVYALAAQHAQAFWHMRLHVCNSAEDFFFEKCVWIRAHHMLRQTQCGCFCDALWQDRFFQAACTLYKKPRANVIAQVADALDQRLNLLLESQRKQDFAAEALAGVLGQLLLNADAGGD